MHSLHVLLTLPRRITSEFFILLTSLDPG